MKSIINLLKRQQSVSISNQHPKQNLILKRRSSFIVKNIPKQKIPLFKPFVSPLFDVCSLSLAAVAKFNGNQQSKKQKNTYIPVSLNASFSVPTIEQDFDIAVPLLFFIWSIFTTQQKEDGSKLPEELDRTLVQLNSLLEPLTFSGSSEKSIMELMWKQLQVLERNSKTPESQLVIQSAIVYLKSLRTPLNLPDDSRERLEKIYSLWKKVNTNLTVSKQTIDLITAAICAHAVRANPKKGVSYFKEGYDIYLKQYGALGQQTITMLTLGGDIHLANGNTIEAASLYEEALEFRRLKTPRHEIQYFPLIFGTVLPLAYCYVYLGKKDRAKSLIDEQLHTLNLLEASPKYTVSVLENFLNEKPLPLLLHNQITEFIMKKILSYPQEFPPFSIPQRLTGLAFNQTRADRIDDAIYTFRQAETWLDSTKGALVSYNEQKSTVYYGLATCHALRNRPGDVQEAIRYYEAALEQARLASAASLAENLVASFYIYCALHGLKEKSEELLFHLPSEKVKLIEEFTQKGKLNQLVYEFSTKLDDTTLA